MAPDLNTIYPQHKPRQILCQQRLAIGIDEGILKCNFYFGKISRTIKSRLWEALKQTAIRSRWNWGVVQFSVKHVVSSCGDFPGARKKGISKREKKMRRKCGKILDNRGGISCVGLNEVNWPWPQENWRRKNRKLPSEALWKHVRKHELNAWWKWYGIDEKIQYFLFGIL